MSTSDTQTFGDRLTGTTFEHTLVIGDGPYDHLSHTIQLHGNDSAPRLEIAKDDHRGAVARQ